MKRQAGRFETKMREAEYCFAPSESKHCPETSAYVWPNNTSGQQRRFVRPSGSVVWQAGQGSRHAMPLAEEYLLEVMGGRKR